ncbi:MAG TPA: GtrA family protein [Acidimicrobiales bacterium]|nr:GtrA family protein [Acidimicrobiales bacterium]
MHPAFARTLKTYRWRVVKYASVSAIATVTSLVVLGVLVGALGLPSVGSNIAATAIGTVPSFELNRRWVWSVGGRKPALRQVLPFCLLSFAGLVISSLAVHFASAVAASSGRLVRTTAVEMANVCSYGALWLFQFLLCDRVLFKPSRAAAQRLTGSPAPSAASLQSGPKPRRAGAVP